MIVATQVPLKKCLDKIKTCSRMSCPGKVWKISLDISRYFWFLFIFLLQGSSGVWERWCHIQKPLWTARGPISCRAFVLVGSSKNSDPLPRQHAEQASSWLTLASAQISPASPVAQPAAPRRARLFPHLFNCSPSSLIKGGVRQWREQLQEWVRDAATDVRSKGGGGGQPKLPNHKVSWREIKQCGSCGPCCNGSLFWCFLGQIVPLTTHKLSFSTCGPSENVLSPPPSDSPGCKACTGLTTSSEKWEIFDPEQNSAQSKEIQFLQIISFYF